MKLNGTRALFISYNGMLEPLGQSQVIPYLKELAEEGVQFTLLSFERSLAFTHPGEKMCKELTQQLTAANIEWHWLPYHKTPSLLATAYDVLVGLRYASSLVRRRGIELVHARSHVPAAIALLLKKLFGVKMIFDIRGLMAEEYVDAKRWKEGQVKYRLTKAIERRALQASDAVVTLTERIWPVIRDWDGLRGRTEVIHKIIPCCSDLEVFSFSEKDRNRRRSELNLADRFIVTYSGSVGGWYRTKEMADFFLELLKQKSESHFLWLTNGDPRLIQDLMSERKIAREFFTIKSVRPLEVPSYLSASDLGLAFYQAGISRYATSPVKVSEYLACGLSVLINEGIGDTDALVTNEGVGVVVKEFTARAFAEAIAQVDSLLKNQPLARLRARAVAEKYFDIHHVGRERYSELYREVLGA